jgi:hypothetical protein
VGLADHLPPTFTPDGSGVNFYSGISSVEVIPLSSGDGNTEFWAAYSAGSRSVNPIQNHFVAIFSYTNNIWTQISRINFINPDFIEIGALEQAPVESNDIWMQYSSGVGSHASCYHILRFDGETLQDMVAECSSSPNAGELRDLDGDGNPEILINRSEDYVFCYECGVKIWSFGIWRWDNSNLVEVELKRLQHNTPESIRELNNAAISLAEAELWMGAQEMIHQALSSASENELVIWNAAQIDLFADARLDAITDSPYPLLSQVFYGDYAAAVNQLREYLPKEIFNFKSPLLVGTIAEGNEKSLKNWVVSFSDKALKAKPELASAYFLRGWVKYIAGSDYSDVLSDITRASQLAPEDLLFTESVLYLLRNR